MDNLKEATVLFEIAENHFNWADSEHIEDAIKEFNNALENLNNIRSNMGMLPIEV